MAAAFSQVAPARRIRLCMAVNNLDVGGLERLVISLLRALPKERYELSLICLSGQGKLFSQIDLAPENCLVLDKSPDLGGWREKARLPLQVLQIARFLRDKEIDILDVHNLAPLVFAGGAARLLPNGPRVIYTEHNQIHRANARGKARFRHYARLAHEVVTVSRDLERTLVDKIGVTTPVKTIHNGIDGARFGRPSDGHIRRELGIAEDAFVIGTAVVLSKQKGIEHLLDATKLVHAKAPDIQFVIAGDGPLRGELEKKASALGLGKNVRFIGYRSDIPELIASFDTYVLPSLWEGLPLALLEALATGVPIVATTVGGNPEVVEHGKNGFLVPPADSASLASHLLGIHDDAALRAQIRKNSPAKFAAQFSLAAMLRAYEDLFEEHVRARKH